MEAGVWTVPAARMKASREHRVPLSGQALQILRECRDRWPGSQYLFPGRYQTSPLSNMALLMLMRRLGRKEVPHGLRSSFRDWAADNRKDRDLAEAALAHIVADRTEAAYRRTDLLEARRALMDAWGEFVGDRHGRDENPFSIAQGGELPGWILERSKDEQDFLRGRCEAFYRVMECDGGFKRLEVAGCCKLDDYARQDLVLTLAFIVLDLSERAPDLKKMRRYARDAEALADAIESHLHQVHFRFRNPIIELPLRLRHYAHQMDPAPGVSDEMVFGLSGPELSKTLKAARRQRLNKRGRQVDEHIDDLIDIAAVAYHGAGGHVAIGTGGFARFLAVLWEFIPKSKRCGSAAALVERAKRRLPILRKRIKTISKQGEKISDS